MKLAVVELMECRLQNQGHRGRSSHRPPLSLCIQQADGYLKYVRKVIEKPKDYVKGKIPKK